jgi:aspartyl-tRNA(Asn)/glutamyl-tRNA(Gln) amidotransferase subunit A
MTEFAFSGVGINPHYGTPGNPHDRSLIPGGSSAGAPVSVAEGMAAVAIGTDTGGSVRIPAALCGLVGFKPTQYRVPRDGATPLSTTLDSIGPIGVSVACCAVTDAVMAGEPADVPAAVPIEGLRLGIPQTVMLDDLEAPVAAAFERAVSTLVRAGARTVELPLEMLGDYARINIKGGLPVAEAFAWHEKLIERRGQDYDPRIRTRIGRGREMTAAEYIRVVEARAEFIRRFDAETEAFDALVMPTVPMTAPPIAAFARDEDYARLNVKLLRNTSIINFLDRCALSLPIETPGTAPVGLMVVGRHGEDRRLLAIGRGIETVLDSLRRG